jgi:hypothetical protein
MLVMHTPDDIGPDDVKNILFDAVEGLEGDQYDGIEISDVQVAP